MTDRPHRKRVQHFNKPGHAHELTFSCYRRLPLLSKDRSRQWLVDALDRARLNWSLELWAYVIMPEHAHVLMLPQRDDCDMAGVLKTIKQSVARKATNYLRKHDPLWLERLKVVRPSGKAEYRFWQQGPGYDRNVVSPEKAWAMVDYIHQNPVRRGLAVAATDWSWSSARQYAGLSDCVLTMDGRPPDAASA